MEAIYVCAAGRVKGLLLRWAGMIIFTCLDCGEDTDDILAHLRRFHPDVDWEPEFWPDGKPVIYED